MTFAWCPMNDWHCKLAWNICACFFHLPYNYTNANSFSTWMYFSCTSFILYELWPIEHLLTQFPITTNVEVFFTFVHLIFCNNIKCCYYLLLMFPSCRQMCMGHTTYHWSWQAPIPTIIWPFARHIL
jgi:hypothetical protein